MKQCLKLENSILITLVVFAWFCTVNACWVWLFLMGEFSWFHFESLNQSINHRKKEFQRQFDWSWNTSWYIFHALDQLLKSLSFGINSLCSPQRPWAVHLHTGRDWPVYIQCIYRHSFFILSAPGTSHFSESAHQTVHQLDKYRRVIKHCVLRCESEQQACETAHLESWKEAPWERIASWNPLYARASGIRSQDRPFSSFTPRSRADWLKHYQDLMFYITLKSWGN